MDLHAGRQLRRLRRLFRRRRFLPVLLLVIAAASLLVARMNRPTPVQLLPSPTPSPSVSQDYQLAIDRISVKVPITLNVDGNNEAAYLKALETAVAHYQGTARPGEVGNAFIFGHSDYYKNKPGQFKEIFKSLNKVKKDDQVVITHGSERYEYKVYRSEIIKDTDFSVLKPSQEEIISIMTCWPPGTIEKRWIVQAKRVKGDGSL